MAVFDSSSARAYMSRSLFALQPECVNHQERPPI